MLAVHQSALKAADDCRTGCGPVLLELLTYRRTGHSRRDPCHYQPKDEREQWFSRDPIERFAAQLCKDNVATAAQIESIRAEVIAQINAAIQSSRLAPLPTMADLETDVLA